MFSLIEAENKNRVLHGMVLTGAMFGAFKTFAVIMFW